MRRLILLAGLLTALLAAVPAGAQGGTNGTLTAGQPSSMQMVSGDVFLFDYVLEQTSQVTFQVISGTAQPTISIQRDGVEVAAELNPGGAFAIELTSILSSGSYLIEIAGANNTSGLVILSVQNQTPVPVAQLTPGVTATGILSPAQPVAVFEFGPLAEASFLFIDTFLPDRGVDVRIVNVTSGADVGSSSAEVLGARFQFAPSANLYQLQVGGSGTQVDTPFDVCLTFLRVGGCSGSVTVQPTQVSGEPTPVATEEVAAAACTVTPNASGGVNIRQSATTASIVVGALPTGTNAPVLGKSPDGSFFNIELNGINGWVSAGVVTANGDCANLPTVQPPAPIIPPTATPVPTNTPVPPPPTASGPCLFTITSPTFVYTTTIELIDYLYDQVQSGELIPNGRTADGQWFRLNYASSWLPASAIGQTVSRSGNCNNLPTVSP